MVVNTDFNLMAALQYGVAAVLHSPHLILCGHYDCGGSIRASIDRTEGSYATVGELVA
jgi:carbonic anhydrase